MTISTSPSPPSSSPTSTSPRARPASRRARCASTPGCSTTSTRRSTTSGSRAPRRRPDRAAVLRHLALAAPVGTAGRGTDGPGRAGADPRLRALPRADRCRERSRCCRSCPRTLTRSYRARARAPPLSSLRCVSVTGEAVTSGPRSPLVRRSAGGRAGQRLRADRDLGRHQPRGDGPRRRRGAGAARPPDRQRPRLRGRRAPRARPLGAPGEIVFSGICVGRGYVNDPERTHAAFRPIPTARASASTEAAIGDAGGPTASSRSSAAATAR